MSLKAEILLALGDVLADICRNPLMFVSETDIHYLLMERLRARIPLLRRLYATNASIGMNNAGVPSREKYKTMLIHKEYGHGSGMPWARSDFVILRGKGREGVGLINDPINLKTNKRYLKPLYIFEIGSEKSEASREGYGGHLRGDITKLTSAEELGFAIHIHRNYFKSKRVTGKYRRNRSKRLIFETITKDALRVSKSRKVVPLIFWIEIGADARIEKQKVFMFNPANGVMRPVPSKNKKMLQREITGYLLTYGAA